MSSTTSTATPPRHAFEQAVEEVKLSKTDLNKVIMDYLTSEGYPLAAQKFAAEANMQPTPDLDAIQERVEIREAIQSGDIQTAIEKINELAPQILDRDHALHFSLLRLQLIELIRTATSTPNGDIAPALNFATTHLAPRAPTSQYFLDDLEQTMALLIFEPGKLAPSLTSQLDPSLRQDVAKRVNEALLESQSQRTRATLYDLVNHRAWAQQKALELKKDSIPERIELGFDAPKTNGNATTGGVGNGVAQNGSAGTQTQSHRNGSGGVEREGTVPVAASGPGWQLGMIAPGSGNFNIEHMGGDAMATE